MIVISEYGLKIKNIEASTLFEYNKGLRDHYEYKDAMFTNSLFKDYICANGMKAWKDESTKDIICLEFNYGTRSFDEEIKHIQKIAKKARIDFNVAKNGNSKLRLTQQENKKRKIEQLYAFAMAHKDDYDKKSKEEIRALFYNDGVSVEYLTYDKRGGVKRREIIHYKMLYRSTGKAKKGSCMFIRDSLWKKAHDFLYMGIKLPKHNAKIVEISAYCPLVSSAIVGKVKINPRNILIVKDVDVPYYTNVISIETDANKRCMAVPYENYKLKNTLFDGQALIDSSIFPPWGRGYILLRHHFTKMAAFSANIQQFYRDKLGDDYETAVVKDMWGNEHFAKDIEMITTENAIKWAKFNISYEYWCSKVEENGCEFGIVKTAHPSKLGDVQKMSYQMVNSLDEATMPEVCAESLAYIERLKTDDEFFKEYLKKNANFSNDYEVLVALCDWNPQFVQSSYFRERKRKIIMGYVQNFKFGKVIQNADNLVIVGSPYAMLLYSLTGNEADVYNDNALCVEDGATQCYTSRFGDDVYLAEFRSPFNGKNNMGHLHNIYSKEMQKYFNFCDQIIAINMIGTDFQSKNNGSDQDSDSIYVTDQPQIVSWAKHCIGIYPTIENNIPKDTRTYDRSMDSYAAIDNKLAASQLDIGESSNLAQIAQTYDYTFGEQKHKDAVCILSVLAQCAIDNAKRQFDIDIGKEIRRLKKELEVDKIGYPSFWLVVRPDFNRKLINPALHCPMNYLYNLKLDQFRSELPTLPMETFFIKYPIENDRRTCRKVEELVSRFSSILCEYNANNVRWVRNADWDTQNQAFLLHADFDQMMSEIRKVHLSSNYAGLFSWLIDRAFVITPAVKNNAKSKSRIKKNRSLLIKVLYEMNHKQFLSCFVQNCENNAIFSVHQNNEVVAESF